MSSPASPSKPRISKQVLTIQERQTTLHIPFFRRSWINCPVPFFLLHNKNPMPAWLTVLGLALYSWFVYTEPARLVRQRVYLDQIRHFLEQRFGLVNLVRKSNGWDNRPGTKLLSLIWIMCMSFICLVCLYEGKPQVAQGLLVFNLLMIGCMATNQSQAMVQNLTRIILVHQCIVGWYYQAHISPTLLRRMWVSRTICILTMYESLEEAAMQMLVLSLMMDMRARDLGGPPETWYVLMPMELFFFAILPLHLLGISESIAASVTGQEFSLKWALQFSRGLGFFSCLIPLQLVFGMFMEQAARQTPLVFGIVQLTAGLALRLPTVRSKTDGWIAPNTVAFHRPPHNAMGLNAGLTVSAMGMALTLSHPTLFLAFTSVSLVLVLNRSGTYTSIQSNLSMVLGTAILANWENEWLSSMLIFLCLTSSFFSLVLACSKELMYSNFARENEVENFLSHAIKQKFASVGAAVEHILTKHSHFTTLLTAVLEECRMGHARCHSSTLCRNLEQGMRRAKAKTYVANLAEEIKQTTMANKLFVPETTKYISTNVALAMDWEIFHLVLTKFTKRNLVIELIQFNDNNNVLTIKFNRPVPQTHNRVIDVLIASLNGTLNKAYLEIKFKSSHKLPSPKLPVAGLIHDCYAVLAPLRIALIDDNLLIRRNFERLMHSQLGIPVDRILVMGETRQDCVRFLERICLEQFDVAIFDQNLDYDKEVKGNELALVAREMGFKGCLILHSSDAQLAKFLESGVFHGVVEKSAKSATFLGGIVAAWQNCKVES